MARIKSISAHINSLMYLSWMRSVGLGSLGWICTEPNLSAQAPRGHGGQRGPGTVCCVHGSMWWHAEGVRAPRLLPGWLRLWLLLSSSVWPLLKFSKTSRSGSVLVQGKGSSFNWLPFSLTPCIEDRQTLSTVMQASSHRNQAKMNTGVEAGLFAPPWSPNSPCVLPCLKY